MNVHATGNESREREMAGQNVCVVGFPQALVAIESSVQEPGAVTFTLGHSFLANIVFP